MQDREAKVDLSEVLQAIRDTKSYGQEVLQAIRDKSFDGQQVNVDFREYQEREISSSP